MEDVVQVICPYCGQPNDVYIDYSAGQSQSYYEDCQVCCRAWLLQVRIHNSHPDVSVKKAE